MCSISFALNFGDSGFMGGKRIGEGAGRQGAINSEK